MKKFLAILVAIIAMVVFAYETQLNLLDYESISYKVTVEDKSAIVSLQFNKLKTGGYEAVYSVRFQVEDEFDYESFAIPYLYLMLSYIYNPSFLPFLQMVDLENPSTINLYGMKIVYERDEKVGKYTGKRFSFYSGDQKLFSWVASKQVELVLKFEIPDQNYVAELIEFKKR